MGAPTPYCQALTSARLSFPTHHKLSAYYKHRHSSGCTLGTCRIGSAIQTAALPEGGTRGANESDGKEQEKQLTKSTWTTAEAPAEEEEEEEGPSGNTGTILSACVVGVLTGFSVVLFNNGVHEIRDLFWDGIPNRGASWLREEPLDSIWTRVILVPACGGFAVSILNALASALQDPPFIQPVLKALAACFTLGTGNSLGPEGPSVEIGTSIAKGVASLTPFDRASSSGSQSKLSLLAAGSAAGISSGFNAAVAGCFFAVESVLWPFPGDSSPSLTNTTSMVILSAVIASVVSEVGLGSEPSFKVPEYDFRSFGELPLYLLLGIFCGLVSLSLLRCTSALLSFINNLHKNIGIPRAVFPVMGGLATGMIALAYPEILYWGFENVDILLESRPFVNGLSAELLLQLVGFKIVATSLCRASGLVGGYYAPSLFIGAATGMAYGKLINSVVAQSNPTLQLSILEVASPQAYGLVGMAATLAGVCQVPLTAVLLLFELTQDYRIVLPLLGAVGLSSWITSGQTKRRVKETMPLNQRSTTSVQQTEISSSDGCTSSSDEVEGGSIACGTSLCELESSLCVDDSFADTELPRKRICVSEAMRTRYVTVLMNTSLTEALKRMLAEKQSCAMIVDDKNILIGLLTLGDIEDFSKRGKARNRQSEDLLVSEMCSSDDRKCGVPCTANPEMDLLSLQRVMNRNGVSQVPVVSDHGGNLIGLIDKECISVTCRALATRELLR